MGKLHTDKREVFLSRFVSVRLGSRVVSLSRQDASLRLIVGTENQPVESLI